MGIKGFRDVLSTYFPRAITNVPRNARAEFDHVLIDANQIFHNVLRRTKDPGHAIQRGLRQLEQCLQWLTPTKSLVVAMDGPPAVAKLTLQRQKRRTVAEQTKRRLRHLEFILKTEKLKTHLGSRKLAKMRIKSEGQFRTLRITPGTSFMATVNNLLLEWASLFLYQKCHETPFSENLKIFISSSDVPGEGEVKLLEWVYGQDIQAGESIAILGGDADLVLEGLSIPPSITHNVFVFFPETSIKHRCVSIWEMTRTLSKRLPHIDHRDIMNIRTDLTLLFMFMGNDYLPKLNSSPTFRRIFPTYLNLHREWNKQGRSGEASFIDPVTECFRTEFSLHFFKRVALFSDRPKGTHESSDRDADVGNPPQYNQNSTNCDVAIDKLRQHVLNEFIPGPMIYQDVANDECDDSDMASSENNVPDSDEEKPSPAPRHRLTLGNPKGGQVFTYECEVVGGCRQEAQRKLARMALKDLLGDDWEKEEKKTENEEEDEESEEEDDDNEESGEEERQQSASIKRCASDYLYGLLWTIKMYRYGACPTYAFNYGKYSSPFILDLANFFRVANNKGQSVGMQELGHTDFVAPLSPGMSCLAAMPWDAKHFVPKQFRSIRSEVLEKIYATCQQSGSIFFDVRMFERMVRDEMIGKARTHSTDQVDRWIVVSHPKDCGDPSDIRHAKAPVVKLARVDRVTMKASSTKMFHNDILTIPGNQRIDTIDTVVSISDFKYRKPFLSTKSTTVNEIKNPNKQILRESPKSSPQDLPDESGGELLVPLPSRFKVKTQATSDGVTAFSCLVQLSHLGYIRPPMFRVVVVQDKAGKDVPKRSRRYEAFLLVAWGEIPEGYWTKEISYTTAWTDRISQQRVKQYLCSRALSDVVGRQWKRMTFEEIKATFNGKLKA